MTETLYSPIDTRPLAPELDVCMPNDMAAATPGAHEDAAALVAAALDAGRFARLGAWADAEAALLRSIAGRERLAAGGVAGRLVVARAWCDLATVRAAADARAAARDAASRVEAELAGVGDVDCPAVRELRAALAEIEEVTAEHDSSPANEADDQPFVFIESADVDGAAWDGGGAFALDVLPAGHELGDSDGVAPDPAYAMPEIHWLDVDALGADALETGADTPDVSAPNAGLVDGSGASSEAAREFTASELVGGQAEGTSAEATPTDVAAVTPDRKTSGVDADEATLPLSVLLEREVARAAALRRAAAAEPSADLGTASAAGDTDAPPTARIAAVDQAVELASAGRERAGVGTFVGRLRSLLRR